MPCSHSRNPNTACCLDEEVHQPHATPYASVEANPQVICSSTTAKIHAESSPGWSLPPNCPHAGPSHRISCRTTENPLVGLPVFALSVSNLLLHSAAWRVLGETRTHSGGSPSPSQGLTDTTPPLHPRLTSLSFTDFKEFLSIYLTQGGSTRRRSSR